MLAPFPVQRGAADAELGGDLLRARASKLKDVFEVTAKIAVGRSPFRVRLSPTGQLAYVSNEGSATASVINTVLNTVVTTIPVGAKPTSTVAGDRHGEVVHPHRVYSPPPVHVPASRGIRGMDKDTDHDRFARRVIADAVASSRRQAAQDFPQRDPHRPPAAATTRPSSLAASLARGTHTGWLSRCQPVWRAPGRWPRNRCAEIAPVEADGGDGVAADVVCRGRRTLFHSGDVASRLLLAYSLDGLLVLIQSGGPPILFRGGVAAGLFDDPA
ncbi:YncE family protein [Streptomyces sp. NPDC054933]